MNFSILFNYNWSQIQWLYSKTCLTRRVLVKSLPGIQFLVRQYSYYTASVRRCDLSYAFIWFHLNFKIWKFLIVGRIFLINEDFDKMFRLSDRNRHDRAEKFWNCFADVVSLQWKNYEILFYIFYEFIGFKLLLHCSSLLITF